MARCEGDGILQEHMHSPPLVLYTRVVRKYNVELGFEAEWIELECSLLGISHSLSVS